jgi:hypothetical protein
MGDTGIDDDKVIFLDGIFQILHQKTSGSLFYIK